VAWIYKKEVNPMVRAKNPSKDTKGKRGWLVFGISCGVILFIILILLVIYLVIGWQSFQDAPGLVSNAGSDILVVEEYELDQDQMDAYIKYGYPEAFRILFYDEMLTDGSVEPVRLEVWTYYSQGVELTFINGKSSGEDLIDDPQLGDVISPPYYPEQFNAYISLDEVITAAGLDEYAVVPLEKEYLEGSEVYFGPQLSFGMKDGELRMVEVMGMTE
jgi:hypothetical protein